MVGSVLIGSGTASGALVGLVAAVLVAPLAPLFATVPGGTLVPVATGAALDALRLAVGRPAPPTAGRQVPREWSQLFPPRLTAALYGARLGVGPLTILSTWTWWSFTLAAALLGPLPGALTGAVFGLVKLTTIAWVSRAAEPGGHAATFGRLRSRQRRGWGAITALTALLILATTGCGTVDEVADRSVLAPTTTATVDPKASADTDSGGAPHPGDTPATTALISPARLEDVVRTSAPEHPNLDGVTDPPGAASAADPGHGPDTAASTAAPSPASPAALSAALVTDLPGYEPIDSDDADRHLDLRAAAAIQPDPTEEVALLETRGFRGGWLRAFRNGRDDVAVTSVYRFADAAEAEFYLEDGLITIGGYGGTFFDIPGLPGVRGFVQRVAASDGEAAEELVSLGASFHRGDRWYLLYFFGSPDRVTPEVLVPAVRAQVEAAERAVAGN